MSRVDKLDVVYILIFPIVIGVRQPIKFLQKYDTANYQVPSGKRGCSSWRLVME